MFFFSFLQTKLRFLTFYSTPRLTLNGRQKNLFWELVCDLMISSDEQITSAFWCYISATFLVHDGLLALLNTFLLNCDSTTTTQVWARWKHFVSLLQFKTKLNASMTARNKRNKTLITFRQNILQMWESHWCVSNTNSKYCKKTF